MRAQFINEASNSSKQFLIKKIKSAPWEMPLYDLRPVIKNIDTLVNQQETLLRERYPNIFTMVFRIVANVYDGNDQLAYINYSIYKEQKNSKTLSIGFTDLVEREDIANYMNKNSEASQKFSITLKKYFRRKFATEVPITYEIEYGSFYRDHGQIKGLHVMDMNNQFDLHNFVEHGASPIYAQGSMSAQQPELIKSLEAVNKLCPNTLTFKIFSGKVSKTFRSEEEDLIFNQRASLKK